MFFLSMNTELGADGGGLLAVSQGNTSLRDSVHFRLGCCPMFVSVRQQSCVTFIYAVGGFVLMFCVIFYNFCQKSGGQHQFVFFLINSILNRSCCDLSFVRFDVI